MLQNIKYENMCSYLLLIWLQRGEQRLRIQLLSKPKQPVIEVRLAFNH